MSLGRQGYLTLSASVNNFTFIFRVLAILLFGGALTGCAAPLLALGSSSTAAASSVGSSAVAVAVANPSTAASALSSVTTGKSPLEHGASAATKKECNFLNALGPKPICEDILLPPVTDRSELYFGPADGPQTPAK